MSYVWMIGALVHARCVRFHHHEMDWHLFWCWSCWIVRFWMRKDGSSIHVSMDLWRHRWVRQSRKIISKRIDTSQRFHFSYQMLQSFWFADERWRWMTWQALTFTTIEWIFVERNVFRSTLFNVSMVLRTGVSCAYAVRARNEVWL